ncbi:LamG domain-containing protein [Carboxydothermus pertinax]|uniref:LamG-like jellyroll fold domain-containing protein n=1 Tax=Carboxydothermus pertinax TaxID=870242 RepID=A0A1L8CRS2_9THEO|nr:LamG domain-containing protein [Carboxydothermus pertinax]GAV21622.1 hypothetical protein cpu_01320 [Carboxydothermus pertinax]
MISCRLSKDANTVGLWHFTEGSGTTVKDYSGNGYNGTINSAKWDITTKTPFNNTSLSFQNASSNYNQYVVVSNPSLLNLTNNFTLEVVFMFTSWNNGWDGIVTKTYTNGSWNNPYAQYKLGRYSNTYNLGFHIATSTSSYTNLVSQSAISLNKWYYVACTYVGSTQTIYINGNPDATASVTASIPSVTSNLYIGCEEPFLNGAEAFNGKIALVRISNIARSAAEIKHNWLRMAQVLVS